MTETTEKKPLKCSICQGATSMWDQAAGIAVTMPGPSTKVAAAICGEDHPTRARSAPAAAPGLLRLTLSEGKFEEIVNQLRLRDQVGRNEPWFSSCDPQPSNSIVNRIRFATIRIHPIYSAMLDARAATPR